LPRIPWHAGLRGVARYYGAEVRYWNNICKAVGDELHHEDIAEQQFTRQSDSFSGRGEEMYSALDLPRRNDHHCLIFNGLLSLFLGWGDYGVSTRISCTDLVFFL
jgi:hypothetical protein